MQLSLSWKWIVTTLMLESFMLLMLVWSNLQQLSNNLISQTTIRLEAEKSLLRSALIAPLLQMDYSTVQSILEESYMNLNMLYIVVFDSQNRVVAKTGLTQEDTLPTLTPTPLNQSSIMNERYNTSVDITTSGQKIGSAQIGISTRFYHIERESMLFKSIAIALLEIILSALMLVLIAQLINRNFVKLIHSVEGIAKGDYSKRVELGQEKEISKLAMAFNTMAATIQERIVSLEASHDKEQELSKQLEHNAYYDVLTNLPNRVLLSDRLQQAMLRANRNNNSIAIIFLDLDGFKAVNDTYDHYIGDKLLVALSTKMKQILREEDTLSRIGGDEFVIILQDIEELVVCEIILDRLLDVTSQPIVIEGKRLQVSSSIGITLYPEDYCVGDGDQLIRHADQAMYIAKQSGKNQYHFFDSLPTMALSLYTTMSRQSS